MTLHEVIARLEHRRRSYNNDVNDSRHYPDYRVSAELIRDELDYILSLLRTVERGDAGESRR